MNNKNLKVISSLAMAGILAATGISTVSAAAPKSLGVYRKLVSGNVTAAPYVLASRNDRVTTQNLKTDHGSIIVSEGTVKTGTTFKKDNEEHTVIIYGDVNGDGKVDVRDVTAAVNGGLEGISGVKKEAADVRHDGKIDVRDVTAIVNFALADDAEPFNIELEKEPEEETNYEYTLKINGNNVVNNTNNGDTSTTKSELVVDLDKGLDKAKTLVAKIVDENGNVVKKTTSGTPEFTVDVPVLKKQLQVTVPLDLKTGLNITDGNHDGNYKVQLFDGTTKVGEQKFVINTKAPSLAYKRAVRENTSVAKISLEKDYSVEGDDGDIVEIRYAVVKTGGSAISDAKNLKKSISFTNKLENAKIDEILEESASYTLYYQLVNSYGSVSTIKSDITITAETAVEKAVTTIDNISNNKRIGFSWEIEDTLAVGKTKSFVVYLYKDGKVIKTYSGAASSATNTSTTALASVTDNETLRILIPDADLQGSGDYSIGIVVEGATGVTQDSEKKMSPVQTIKALPAVTSSFAVDKDGKAVLSWKDYDAEQANLDSYVIKLSKLVDGKYVAVESTTNSGKELEIHVDKATKEYKFNVGANLVAATDTNGVATSAAITIKENEVYKATVVAKAKSGQVTEVSSDKKDSEGFYVVVPQGSVASTKGTDTSRVLSGITGFKINKKEPTYQVAIYRVIEKTANAGTKYYDVEENPTIKDATVSKEGEIEITGLTQDTQYAFKIIATVDGVKGESGFIGFGADASNDINIKTAPTINGTIVDAANKATEGKIFYDGTTLKINNVTINAADTDYPADFAGTLGLVKQLKAGDTIKVEGNTITATLANVISLDLGKLTETVLTDKTLVLKGSADKAVTISATTDGKEPKEIKLTGEGSIYAVGDCQDAKLILDSGVNVRGNSVTYTLPAGKTAIINAVKVTTESEDTTITTGSGKVLNVTPNKGVNNLTFENVQATYATSTDATITFTSTDPAEQKGTVTLKSEDGKITVTTTETTVTSALDVEVTNGEVDFSDADSKIKGAQKVTVTNEAVRDANGDIVKTQYNTTIKVKAAEKALVAMTDVEIKDYTGKTVAEMDEIIDPTKATTPIATASADVDKVIGFINSFGIDADKAKITTTAGSNDVTIKFYGDFSGEVKGLQK